MASLAGHWRTSIPTATKCSSSMNCTAYVLMSKTASFAWRGHSNMCWR